MASFTPYQRKLLVLLSAATFFEGYDFFALSQVLPNLRADMGLSEAQGGLLVTITGLGTVAAYGVVRLADRLGRRPVMMATILGYALFTGMTGFSRGIWDFAAWQLLARVFLLAEWALAMVYAAEEFPADRRGLAVGILQGWSTLGSIICAGVVPIMLKTAWGWRGVYFVGVVPLILLAFARRGLQETTRFAAVRSGTGAPAGPGLFAIWKTPQRRRVVQLAVIWSLTYVCTQCAVFFWKEYALTEGGLTDAQVAKAIMIASLVSLPLVFSFGKLMDGWGRRPSAVLIYLLLAGSVIAAYQLTGFWPLTMAMTTAIFSVGGVLALLNGYNAELFPTDMRGAGFAWANNLLGRIGYIVAPAVVGWWAGRVGWGTAVSFTSISVIAALVLIMAVLPETRGRELEETARA